MNVVERPVLVRAVVAVDAAEATHDAAVALLKLLHTDQRHLEFTDDPPEAS
jgi:hypothetical protein